MLFKHRLKYLAILAILAACRGEGHTDVSDLAAGKKEEVYGDLDFAARNDEPLLADSKAINFGVTPWGDPAKMRQAYQPLAAYLSEKLKVRVRLLIVQEYRELVTDLRRGIVQIASFSPGAYADALDERIDKDSDYVASAQLDGKNYYRGIILCREEYKDLSALKDKSFAFVETGSSSGYKYPLALFLNKKIDPYRFFAKVYFLGSHPNVVEAVVGGKVDAGATWDGYIEENYPSNPPGVRVLMKTDPIPYDAIVVSKRKRAPSVAALRKLLTSLNRKTQTKKGDKVLNTPGGFPYSGYVVHSTRIYDIVRQTGRAVGNYRKPAEVQSE